MHTLTNRRLGFTLIELMIVVAIIGILLFQGIPAYEKYQAKARTTEVKSSLAAAYTAEKSFYIEHSTYTACLDRAGFGYEQNQTTGGMKYYYTVGFTTTAADSVGCGPNGGVSCRFIGPTPTDLCANANGVTHMLATASLRRGALTPPSQAQLTGGTGQAQQTPSLSNSAFVMAGTGFISKDDKFDRWTVDQNKNIVQVEVGY